MFLKEFEDPWSSTGSSGVGEPGMHVRKLERVHSRLFENCTVEESSKYSYPVIHDPHDIGREEAPSVRVTNRDSLVEIHGSEGPLGIENVSDDDVRTCQGGTKINNIV